MCAIKRFVKHAYPREVNERDLSFPMMNRRLNDTLRAKPEFPREKLEQLEKNLNDKSKDANEKIKVYKTLINFIFVTGCRPNESLRVLTD